MTNLPCRCACRVRIIQHDSRRGQPGRQEGTIDFSGSMTRLDTAGFSSVNYRRGAGEGVTDTIIGKGRFELAPIFQGMVDWSFDFGG
ncbi:MAG: hypothetical protein U0236_07715 [Nitrospira sp.]